MGYFETLGETWFKIVSKLRRFDWDNVSTVDYSDFSEQDSPCERIEPVGHVYQTCLFSSQLIGTNSSKVADEGLLPENALGERLQMEPPVFKHLVAVDLDIPAVLVPSSTLGHSHLIIDKELTWPQYRKLLEVLGEVGILEEGYVAASLRRNTTHIRAPWFPKEWPPTAQQTRYQQEAIDLEELMTDWKKPEEEPQPAKSIWGKPGPVSEEPPW